VDEHVCHCLQEVMTGTHTYLALQATPGDEAMLLDTRAVPASHNLPLKLWHQIHNPFQALVLLLLLLLLLVVKEVLQ
jgi:hypothetical protein